MCHTRKLNFDWNTKWCRWEYNIKIVVKFLTGSIGYGSGLIVRFYKQRN